ncbi:MAG: acetylornithine transaminase [Armatimonadota bacterium]|nr:acetylornithine transaminase [bacterium]MDW8320736.1 acetylornithine transaminase [Armatimonadota bacterium]
MEGRGLLEELQAIDAQHIMSTYARQPVVFVKGCGARLWDAGGKEYIDFLGGIAVDAVGHCHPRVLHAIQEQAGKLLHVSNLFYTEPQFRLAQKLTVIAGMDKVFFCNSGAEANECALKIARKWGKRKEPPAIEIVAAEGAFHGRLFGTLSVTAQAKYQQPYEPLVPGVRIVPRNDVCSLRKAITEHTCAVILEPIQGESGVHPLSIEFLRTARECCNHVGAFLIFDEVQTGMGRTGTWFMWQQLGVQPDILTSAKALGGGLPVGACMACGEAANVLERGDHGSTFAGGPLVASASLAAIEAIEEEGMLYNARTMGAYLCEQIALWRERLPVTEIRGAGLMIGFDIAEPVAREVVRVALREGVVVNATGENTIRLLPPLNLQQEEADEGLRRLRLAIESAVAERTA